MNNLDKKTAQPSVRRGFFATIKKITAVLTAVILTLGIVSCGKQEKPEKTTTTPTITTSRNTAVQTTVPDSSASDPEKSITTAPTTKKPEANSFGGKTTAPSDRNPQGNTTTAPVGTTKPNPAGSMTKASTSDTSVTTEEPSKEPVGFNEKDNPALLVQRMNSGYRTVYRRLKDGFDAHDAEIAIPDGLIHPEDMSELIQLVLVVEYGYAFVGENFTMTVSSGGYVTRLKPNYIADERQRTRSENALDDRIDDIIANVPENANEYERLLYIHDEIVTNCSYQDSGAQSYSAYGCLVEGKAVCQGYAMAFLRLCSEIGVECIPVFGRDNSAQGGGVSHMWNKVKLNGKWYNVDVTWDDPTFSNEVADYVRYNFFCVSDTVIYKEHEVIASSFYSYPAATATKYDYFKYYGYIADNTSEAESIILKQLKDAAKTGEKYIYLRCSSESAFYTVKQDLFAGDGQARIFKVIAKGQSQYGGNYRTDLYSSSDSDVYYTITLTLQY